MAKRGAEAMNLGANVVLDPRSPDGGTVFVSRNVLRYSTEELG